MSIGILSLEILMILATAESNFSFNHQDVDIHKNVSVPWSPIIVSMVGLYSVGFYDYEYLKPMISTD